MLNSTVGSFVKNKVNKVNHGVLYINAAGRKKESVTNTESLKEKTLKKLQSSQTQAEATGISANNTGYALELQYNPQSISFHSSGSRYMRMKEGAGAKAENTQLAALNKGSLTMSVKLYFEHLVPDHAFFSSTTNYYSIGQTGINKLKEKIMEDTVEEDSVQLLVEGLVGSMMQQETRMVTFFWSDMSFSGELNSVNATYTMFNIDGSPCQAEVELQILQKNVQTDQISREQGAADQDYWNQAYKKL